MPKDAAPEFEVATIKPAPPDSQGYGFHSNGRRIWFDNQTAISMMNYFYGVSSKQVVGGPAWLGTDRYDVDGVPDILGVPSVKQMLGMYQKLMADRFQFSFHREKRNCPPTPSPCPKPARSSSPASATLTAYPTRQALATRPE